MAGSERHETPDYGLLDRLATGWPFFYPRPDRSPPPPGARDETVEVEAGVRVACRFYPLAQARPSLLFFHGNGEVASDYDEIAALYHRAGVNLWVADYRGYGASEGRPSFAALVGDAPPVLERFHAALDEWGFAGPRFVMGRSLGTHPALELAANHAGRLRGLIVESGAGNLRRLVQRLTPSASQEEAERLVEAHQRKVEAIRLPALIIHGEADELVPVQTAFDLYETLRSEPKELLIIPGAGHNDLLWLGAEPYMQALGSFVAANG